jgi:dihydroorotate dehydrogenase
MFSSLYPIFKPALFRLDPEAAHQYVLGFADPIFRLLKRPTWSNRPLDAFGLSFPNRVGLAAGFDKNAEHLHTWRALGFGFVEVGTITPKPQTGNERPRLFRLQTSEALINRMGFNNDGALQIAEKLRKRPSDLLVGGNIGKNKDTPENEAHEDYKTCFRAVADCVDFITINVSSPNTPGLRLLQQSEALIRIVSGVQDLNMQRKKPLPVTIKVAPNISPELAIEIAEVVREYNIAGVVCTNTTIERDGLQEPLSEVASIGPGGLSGRPLHTESRKTQRLFRTLLPESIQIIASGGISDLPSAQLRVEEGASLIEIYTALVYRGPKVIEEIIRGLT